MLEIFLEDREYDFTFFVFDGNDFRYEAKSINNLNSQEIDFYRSLANGTIILNNVALDVNNVSKEQAKYVKLVKTLVKKQVSKYKKDYQPKFIKYASGNDPIDWSKNMKRIEVPDPKKFKEWT